MAVAGSATKKVKRGFDGYAVEWSWVADSLGDVTEVGTFTANGYWVQVDYYPGTAADLYDLTVLDAGGKDVLRGGGANLPNAAANTYETKYRMPVTVDNSYFFFINEPLTPTIANGGNLGTGTIVFKFSRSQP